MPLVSAAPFCASMLSAQFCALFEEDTRRVPGLTCSRLASQMAEFVTEYCDRTSAINMLQHLQSGVRVKSGNQMTQNLLTPNFQGTKVVETQQTDVAVYAAPSHQMGKKY